MLVCDPVTVIVIYIKYEINFVNTRTIHVNYYMFCTSLKKNYLLFANVSVTCIVSMYNIMNSCGFHEKTYKIYKANCVRAKESKKK